MTSSIFGTGFIVIPKICQDLGGFAGSLLGVTFFACLVIAGISSQVSIVETVVGNLQEEFKIKRKLAVALVVSFMLTGVTLYAFGNGVHLIGIIDSMTAGFNVLLAGLIQIILFAFVSKEVAAWEGWQASTANKYFLWGMLRTVAPVVILVILGTNFVEDLEGFGTLAWVIKWSWFVGALVLSGLLVWRANFLAKNATES